MRVKNISYPHPVLGNGDDAQGRFDVKFSHKLSGEKIELKPSFSLQNKTLESFVRKGKAVFTAEVECNSTFYRTIFETLDETAVFNLDGGKVREQVLVAFYVRSKEDMPAYQIEGCHKDYEGFSFSVKKGDILASGGIVQFIAEKDFDPLRPAVSSLMAVQKGSHREGPAYPDYEENKITIELSSKDWDSYIAVKGRKAAIGILHATIVLPVLAEAVSLIKEGGRGSDLSQYHWFPRLEVILQQKGAWNEDPVVAAQKVLGLPVNRSLAGTKNIFEENATD